MPTKKPAQKKESYALSYFFLVVVILVLGVHNYTLSQRLDLLEKNDKDKSAKIEEQEKTDKEQKSLINLQMVNLKKQAKEMRRLNQTHNFLLFTDNGQDAAALGKWSEMDRVGLLKAIGLKE